MWWHKFLTPQFLTVRWETKTGAFLETRRPANQVLICSSRQQRNPVSNKVEGEDLCPTWSPHPFHDTWAPVREHMNTHTNRIAKTILNNKRITIIITTEFNLYYSAVVIKTTWYWHKNRHVDQCNSIEVQHKNPYTNGHLLIKNSEIHTGKKTASSKWCWSK